MRAALGKALRSQRLRLGLKQSEVALGIGMHQSNLSRIEAGKIGITVGMLSRICAALDVKPWVILRRACQDEAK